jgi:translation initiation factor eIF-2B subunit delta
VPILHRADLILLGASALHSDGSLYSRSGTALVATLAKEHRIPVVACVETYKFGERVILDGLASNELGDAEALLSIPVNKALGVKKPLGNSLKPLSLMYDLTPPSLITAVCTEVSVTRLGRATLMSRLGLSPRARCRLFWARLAVRHRFGRSAGLSRP